jgi:FkbM family methyltransferase
MKSFLQRVLQAILGFETYLFVFSLFKIKTLKWDMAEKDFFFFKNLIPSDGLVLDLGANIGIMSYHLSKHLLGGQVIAFEPIPWNVKTLNRISRFHHLSNIKVNEIALGNNSNPLRMVVPVVKGVKKQGLSHVLSPELTDFNEGIMVEVNQTTLDIYCSDLAQKVDAIKIDVENFEYQVFLGAESLINNDRPMIYCELWKNKNRDDCFDFLTRLNYKIMVVVNQKLVNFEPRLHTTQNFIFIPN